MLQEEVYFWKPVSSSQRLAYVLADENLTVLTHSKRLKAWGGKNSGSLIGLSLVDVFVELVGAEETLRKILAREQDSFTLSQVNRSLDDGQLLYYDLHVRPLRELGRVLLLIVNDVTERASKEQQVRQQRNELRLLNAELQARNEELDAFAHTLAHSLQNLLTPIVISADVLKQELTDVVTEEARQVTDIIARNSQRMSQVIEALLLLADARRAEIMLLPLDMASIVAEVQGRLAGMVEAGGAEMVVPATWPRAWGYAPWVEEVWENYLSNALKYGGESPRIELGATVQQDGQVRFWVRDDGPGIAPDEQVQLFIPFVRLKHANLAGHGLGLSIVRRIVEKLGGQVGVQSAPGQGSTFWFALPAAGPRSCA